MPKFTWEAPEDYESGERHIVDENGTRYDNPEDKSNSERVERDFNKFDEVEKERKEKDFNVEKPSIGSEKLKTMNTATDIEKEVFKTPITRENANPQSKSTPKVSIRNAKPTYDPKDEDSIRDAFERGEIDENKRNQLLTERTKGLVNKEMPDYKNKSIYELDEMGWYGDHNYIVNRLRNSRFDTPEEARKYASEFDLDDKQKAYVNAYINRVFDVDESIHEENPEPSIYEQGFKKANIKVDADTLKKIDNLPDKEQNMILKYLMAEALTPGFGKNKEKLLSLLKGLK